MAKLPGAGELRHRLAFDRRIETNPDAPNDYGNTVSGWQQQFEVWAAMRPRGGSEAVLAARLEGRNLMGVYVRSSPNTREVNSDWRVRDAKRGTEYAVVYVDAVTNAAWVYLDLRSGVAA